MQKILIFLVCLAAAGCSRSPAPPVRESVRSVGDVEPRLGTCLILHSLSADVINTYKMLDSCWDYVTLLSVLQTSSGFRNHRMNTCDKSCNHRF